MSRVKAMKKPCFAEKYGFFIGYIHFQSMIFAFRQVICPADVIFTCGELRSREYIHNCEQSEQYHLPLGKYNYEVI